MKRSLRGGGREGSPPHITHLERGKYDEEREEREKERDRDNDTGSEKGKLDPPKTLFYYRNTEQEKVCGTSSSSSITRCFYHGWGGKRRYSSPSPSFYFSVGAGRMV